MLFIRDLPPVSTVDLKLDEPSIYFGELSNDYVLVKTHQPEFHYPRGDDNVDDVLRRHGRRADRQLLRRLLFAIRFAQHQHPGHEPADAGEPDHVPPADRRSGAASWRRSSTFDTDPYPVVSDGRLFWIQDAYTTTHELPVLDARSTPQGGDAQLHPQLGEDRHRRLPRVDVVLSGRADRSACADARERSSRACCSRSSEMPADLRAHVRYPEDIFKMQATVYQTYHMTNPPVFYNKEDQWQVPSLDVGAERRRRCSRTTRSCGCPARRSPSSSRCCRSRRGSRTTWRPGWWRAATARTTASCSSSSSRSRRSSSARSRSSAGSTRTR